MEELLSILPPYLTFKDGRAYLTVSRWDDGWQACYVGQGYAEHGYDAFGDTPTEALLLLKENIDLLHTLKAQSGQAEY